MVKFSKLFKKILRRYMVLLAILLVVLVSLFLFNTRGKKEPLQFATTKKQPIQSTISTSGVLAGKNTADLKFRSAGKIAYMNVKTGDQVQAQQVITGLDTQDLLIALQQAQNNYRDKQATVDKIYDDLKNHSTDETFAQRQTRTTAEVARDNAFDSLKSAQRAFQDSTIVTPIPGTITQANFIAGQAVSASDVIAQVVDFSQTYFDADVDEADIGKIEVGQKAEVTLNAYENRTFSGQVEQILPLTKTTSSGATVVTTRIKLDPLNINLIPNLNGQVNIITSQRLNALTIPIEALGENDMIVVKNQQGLKRVKVQLGIRSDTDVEILSGLQEGDSVVKNPSAVNLQNRSNNLLSRLSRSFGFSIRR